MKIDAINFGAFTNSTPAEKIKAEETNNSAIDEYDDTRYAKQLLHEPKFENPIEHKNGTVEDLIALQHSTEKMAQSYGFANVADAQSAISNSSQSQTTSSVSPVGGSSSSGLNA